MKIVRFDREVGKKVTHFDSNFVLSRLLRTNGQTQVSAMHLEENGIIGYHEARVPQMLLVVSGTGYVRSGEQAEQQIGPGEAVYWKQGEWHETRTVQGLMAIVVESAEEELDIRAPFK
ncbi:cupin [Alteribacter lacisalsi]|uniref:Cupin n=1 Tax=Alteribacter lacisalsi TaxID=2045244 RepID=A0A2W0HCQ6_9BACI|nr:cupin domain-containing protein [Alteribacter lacisalsi]PYZ98977.1 cupin [Alteribacter lacisalsi]